MSKIFIKRKHPVVALVVKVVCRLSSLSYLESDSGLNMNGWISEPDITNEIQYIGVVLYYHSLLRQHPQVAKDRDGVRTTVLGKNLKIM